MTTATQKASIDSVLAYAYAHTHGGADYVPTSHRDETEPTVDKVRRSLLEQHEIPFEERDYYNEVAELATDVLADVELLAEIKVSALKLGDDTRYGHDLRQVLINGYPVGGREMALLTSLIQVYHREKERADLQAKMPQTVKGYLGHIGERIHDIKLVVKTVRYNTNRWGESTFLVGVTTTGHTVVWKASRQLDVEPGQTIVMNDATIKDLEVYKAKDGSEIYQTIVTRASVQV